MARLDTFIHSKEKRFLCPAKDLNTTAARSFYKYLEENPEMRHKDASLLIFVSIMKDSFCR